MDTAPTGWRYYSAAPNPACDYLWPELRRQIVAHDWPELRAFDLGCGNGTTANMLSKLGFDVTGVDISEGGIDIARKSFPQIRFEVGSGYDDLKSRYGTFPLVLSLEVIEHCYRPQLFARTFLSLIAPGGLGLLSTPYHGYWKHLALALTGRAETHFSPLWDGGHIKFFSARTLDTLLRRAGASEVSFVRVGRIPPLAKSIIALVRP